MSLVLSAATATAQEPSISTDRPSESATASLVPPGSLQIEAGVRATDKASPHHNQLDLGEVLLRYGVGSRFEVRLGLNSYSIIETGTDTQRGFEDLDLAAKISLFRSARGATLLTLLPSWTLPTGHSDVTGDEHVPGLDLLLDHSLGRAWSLTSNLGWKSSKSHDQRYDQIKGTLLASYGFTSRLSAYLELFGFDREEAGGSSSSYADAGLSFLLGDELVVNGLVGHGLGNTETDLFLGLGFGKRW